MKDSAKVSDLLSAAGLKSTVFRRELLQLFRDADAPLSASRVFELLLKNKKLKGANFDRATLFRNLKMLVEKDILNSTEFGTGAAFYCLNHGDHHHHHVFCTECETARPLSICAVAPMIEQAQKMGFKIVTHRMELLGICPDCA